MAMLCLSDFEQFAQENLSSDAWSYYSCGAGRGQTVRDNEAAFLRYRLRPRVLRDVSAVDTGAVILGQRIAFPVGVGVAAVQQMAHRDRELATARAASKINTCMVLGSLSNTSIEVVAEASCAGLRWFQLYIFTNRDLIRSLILRAERAGYRAIVLTIDQPVPGQTTQQSVKLPPNITFPNLGLSSPVDKNDVKKLFNPSATWEDVDWIRELTSLPIVLKGILTAEDAVEAVKHGVQGIVVSNHGGRQLDGVLASIDALGEVVRAVEGCVEVYMDGGVRQGTDVLKALALGARAVFIGRPVLWGLAHSGEEGVERVLEILRNEFRTAMMLSGCQSVADIRADLVLHQ